MTQQAAPFVSVCIPTYNGAATLAAAIESVLAQTCTDFELIVIDDGSKDDTQAIIGRYAAEPRLVYTRNLANLGPEGNWNRCLASARGRYFKLLPHDDVLHPDCLARQTAVLEADVDQRIALVFCARDVLGPDGRRLSGRGYPGAGEGVVAAASVLRACVRRGTNLVGEPGGVLMRTALARQIGPFDASQPYVIDLDYWFRLLAHGDAHYCAEALAGFRVSGTQWSVAIGSHQSRDFHRFMTRVARHDKLPTTAWDRICGRVMPTFNNLARLLFYRLYLR